MARFKKGDVVRCQSTEGRVGLLLGAVYEVETVQDQRLDRECSVIKVHGYPFILPERLFCETDEKVNTVERRLQACHKEIWRLQDEMIHLRKFGIDDEYNKKFKADKRKDKHYAKK